MAHFPKTAGEYMSEFKKYHPIVNLVYFVFVTVLSCMLMHPVCLAASLICSAVYFAVIKGAEPFKQSMKFVLPTAFAAAVINPMFNHAGVTVIAYFPNGNPLTAESLLYGIAAAAMISSVIFWFMCLNEIMTSDKVICLFGAVAPSLSLIIAMTLRFVPEFSRRFREAADAQKCMGRRGRVGKINSLRRALSVFSITVTSMLESGIDTADSMKSRGYGLSGRSAYQLYAFDKRDRKSIIAILVLGIYSFLGYFIGKLHFAYFPITKSVEVSLITASFFAAFILLCVCPIIIELREEKRWKATE